MRQLKARITLVVVLVTFAGVSSGCHRYRLAPMTQIRSNPQQLMGKRIRTIDPDGSAQLTVRWVRYPNVGGLKGDPVVNLRTVTRLEFREIDPLATTGVVVGAIGVVALGVFLLMLTSLEGMS